MKSLGVALLAFDLPSPSLVQISRVAFFGAPIAALVLLTVHTLNNSSPELTHQTRRTECLWSLTRSPIP
jgi:hypothetical protein